MIRFDEFLRIEAMNESLIDTILAPVLNSNSLSHAFVFRSMQMSLTVMMYDEV